MPIPNSSASASHSVPDSGTSLTENIELPGTVPGALHTVRGQLRRPADASQPVPVLLILAGIKTGHQTLDRLPPPGNNAVIAYAYPYDRERWRRQTVFGRALVAWRMSRAVSGQILTLLRWVREQPWADRARINVAGGSLGAIVLPMVLRYIQQHEDGPGFRTATFMYGGAGRASLGYLSLRHRSKLLALATGGLAWLFLRHLEPALHLPHLRGDFLVISSPEDELVPERNAYLLEDLLAEPKEIIHMKGDHVDATNPELLFEVVRVGREWMLARDAFNR